MMARSATERKMRGLRIATLRLRRQRADLDEAEPRGKQLARHARVLVEAGRHAERVGKVEAEERLREARIVGLAARG